MNMSMHKPGVDAAEADEDVVGLDKDVEQVLSRAILNEEQGLTTSIIKGMVGTGKTTLARQLYNHADVVTCKFHKYWVSVSSDMSHNEVLAKLVLQLVDSDQLPKDTSRIHMDRWYLKKMIRQLEGKRYLIVLDDMRKETRLEYILTALPHQDNGSRLLLTSRSQNIRAGIHYTHEMKTLDSDKSWNLFSKTISCVNKFISEHEFPKELEKMGREMLTKCDGLPLAIKEVGKQLAKKRQSGSAWGELLESIDLDSVLDLLESFYVNLKKEKRLCFLHMGFFKENTTMRAKKLLQIWAAGGILISEFETKSYLTDLVNESIIEVNGKHVDCEIKSCRINAILHRLSIKKAEKDMGFEILRSNGNSRPFQTPSHRVINCSRETFNYSTNQDKHLVSLFFHGGGYLDASPSYWKSFEQLWILDLEDFGLKVLPQVIGTLIELRYLGLRNNYLRELPHSLGCLKKLKSLDIALNFMVEVPNIIRKMHSLRHLYMSDVICREPLMIDELMNLETLTYISFDNWTFKISNLQMMTRLRKLGIQELVGNSDVSKLFVSLTKVWNLQNLILRGFRFRSMPCLDDLCILQNLSKLKLDGVLPRLPTTFPPSLRYLKLVNSRLDQDPMPVLEKLSGLIYLKLRNAYTGQQMVIAQGVEVLCMQDLWNLRNAVVGKVAMERLKKLEINNCPYLEILPEDIGSISSLEELKMVTTKIIGTKI